MLLYFAGIVLCALYIDYTTVEHHSLLESKPLSVRVPVNVTWSYQRDYVSWATTQRICDDNIINDNDIGLALVYKTII